MKFSIGIDIGGTKIAGGIVDSAGNVFARRSIPTRAELGGWSVLEETLALTRQLFEAAHHNQQEITGIGISICELVDPLGNITSDYTIKWFGLPINTAFAQLAPTLIEADVRAHALAEAQFGAGKEFADFVFVSIGTGISSCLVQHGKPYAGKQGNALVLSTMPVTVFDDDGRKIEFALEPFASGAGMVARYSRFQSSVTRVEEIVVAAQRGDAQASTILESGGEALGSAIAWLVNVLDPEAIILGGGLGLAEGLYHDRMIATIRSHIFADNSRNLPILHATCGADAGIIGAAVKISNL